MSPDQDNTVDAVLAGALARRLDGQSVDAEALVAGHPEIAAELRQRLGELARLEDLWRDLAPAREGAAPPTPVEAGLKIEDYIVERELGRGGMGVVYAARQLSLGRMVALKVIPRASILSETTRQRFIREARAMAAMAHPNIVPVHAAGESSDHLFIAMELVEGRSLADVLHALRRSPGGRSAGETWRASLAGSGEGACGSAGSPAGGTTVFDRAYIEQVCRLVAQVARALHYAHERGIIHRDVKPANILIDRAGRPLLADFGLAAIRDQPHVTLSGEFFGTPCYVSPEQARGQVGIDRRVDVYSLGATLYECLALAPPFDGASAMEVLAKVFNDEPAPPRKLRPGLPRDLQTIALTALAKEPGSRYATAEAMAQDIDLFLDGQPIRARPVGLVTRAIKRIRRRPIRTALAVAVVVALAAGGIGYRNWRAYQRSQQSIRARALFDEGLAVAYVRWPDGAEAPRDDARALAILKSAADLGHTPAMKELAVRHFLGLGTAPDPQAAARWAARGSDLGDMACRAWYGNYLVAGGTDPPRGMRLLHEAASAGEPAAKLDLARILLAGEGGQARDRPRAMAVLEELAASSNPLVGPMALFHLGTAHEIHIQGPPDLAAARRCYERAAAAGNSLAMVSLGMMCLEGRGGPPDEARGLSLLAEAADRYGNRTASFNLGAYYLGQGTDQSLAQARACFARAAQAGDPNAMTTLGTMLYAGQGGAASLAEAAAWFERAAGLGQHDAMLFLAGMCQQGAGVPRDNGKSLQLLERAARSGYPPAMVAYGQRLEQGDQDRRPDPNAAFGLYRRAADAGFWMAMERLADCYERGIGVQRDPAAANEWLAKAQAAKRAWEKEIGPGPPPTRPASRTAEP